MAHGDQTENGYKWW